MPTYADEETAEWRRQQATLRDEIDARTRGPRSSRDRSSIEVGPIELTGIGAGGPEIPDVAAAKTIKDAGLQAPATALEVDALAAQIRSSLATVPVRAERGVWAGSAPTVRNGEAYRMQEIPKQGSTVVGRATISEQSGGDAPDAADTVDGAMAAATADPDPLRYRDRGPTADRFRDPKSLEYAADALEHRRGHYENQAAAHAKAAKRGSGLGKLVHSIASNGFDAQAQRAAQQSAELQRQAKQARQVEQQGGGIAL
jgi:hypothetical protein